MPEQKIPFLKLFSAWRPEGELAHLAGGSLVAKAVIDKAARSIRAEVLCPQPPSAELKARWEQSLAAAYHVQRVELGFRDEGPAAPAREQASAAPAQIPAPAPPRLPPPRPSPPRPRWTTPSSAPRRFAARLSRASS